MAETYPVLPLKNTVVYPQIVIPLAVGRTKSLAAVKAGVDAEQRIITAAQKQAGKEDPAWRTSLKSPPSPPSTT